MKKNDKTFEPTKSACKRIMSIIKRCADSFDETEIENTVFTILGNLADEIRSSTDCFKIQQEERDA